MQSVHINITKHVQSDGTNSAPELSSSEMDSISEMVSSEVRPLFLGYPSCPLPQNPHIRHCTIYKRMQKLHCVCDFTDSANLNSFTEHMAPLMYTAFST